MKADQLVGKLVLRTEPVQLSDQMVDTEFMATPHIIEKYSNGGITLVNPKTGYKQWCNHEWDDDKWEEAGHELLLKNFHRKYPGMITVKEVLEKIDFTGNALQAAKKEEQPSNNGPEVIRHEKITDIVAILSDISKHKNDGDKIVVDCIDKDGRYHIVFDCIGSLADHKRRYRISPGDGLDDPDVIILDCHEFYMKMMRLIQYGVRDFISMLQIGVLMASSNYGMESLKYIEDKEAVVCSGIFMYKARIFSDHAEITRDVGAEDIDCPVVVLSQDESNELNDYMAMCYSRDINFSDL